MKYSILVNTCDKFEDCWSPFFKLWSLYWNDCSGKIFLNTEYKSFSYSGIDITSTKVCAVHHMSLNKRATWSQCLAWALDTINTDIVLYMQEDYFLTDKVDNNMVEYFVSLMNDNPDIPCIQLTDENFPATVKSNIENLYYGDNKHTSYVCCQASLWRKEILKSLIRKHETAWDFEYFGSKRARYMNLKFLRVDPQWVHQGGYQIIPYLFTGIIGGKWYRPVVDLFAKHDIEMDYSYRGFHEKQVCSLKKRIKNKMSIRKVRSIFEIYKMRLLEIFH